MADKKGKSFEQDKKGKPSVGNDQLGENSGEPRFEKSAGAKGGKTR